MPSYTCTKKVGFIHLVISLHVHTVDQSISWSPHSSDHMKAFLCDTLWEPVSVGAACQTTFTSSTMVWQLKAPETHTSSWLIKACGSVQDIWYVLRQFEDTMHTESWGTKALIKYKSSMTSLSTQSRRRLGFTKILARPAEPPPLNRSVHGEWMKLLVDVLLNVDSVKRSNVLLCRLGLSEQPHRPKPLSSDVPLLMLNQTLNLTEINSTLSKRKIWCQISEPGWVSSSTGRRLMAPVWCTESQVRVRP